MSMFLRRSRKGFDVYSSLNARIKLGRNLSRKILYFSFILLVKLWLNSFFHKETEIPFPISRISEKANVIWGRKKRRNKTKVAAELSNESDCSFPHLHLCIIYSKLVSPQHLIAQKIHPFSWGHYSRSMDSRQADVTLNKMPPSAAPSFTMQSFDIKQTHF